MALSLNFGDPLSGEKIGWGVIFSGLCRVGVGLSPSFRQNDFLKSSRGFTNSDGDDST